MDTHRLTIVFDWDGVVFDTGIIRKITEKAFKRYGYESEHVLKTAKKVVHSQRGYSFEYHAKALAPSAVQAKILAQSIYQAMESHPGSFVFPDARRAIMALKRRAYALDILTAGHKEFQEYKLVRSGIHGLFRGIHIVKPGPTVPQNKIRVLEKLARSHDRIVFLDDREDTIASVQKERTLKGKVTPVLVWRKEVRPPAGMRFVKKLSWGEIEKIAIEARTGP